MRRLPFKNLLASSAAAANVCNVVLMRHSELSEGIGVLDGDGKVVGTSKVAARRVRWSRSYLINTSHTF